MLPPLVVRVRWVFGFGAMLLFPWLALVVDSLSEQTVERIINHESVHSRQQMQYGWTFAMLRYFLDSKFRAFLECEAYAADVEWAMNHGANGVDWINYSARILRDQYRVTLSEDTLKKEISRCLTNRRASAS